MRLSDYSYLYAKQLASEAVHLAIDEGWAEDASQLEVIKGRYKIKDTRLFDKIVDAALINRTGRAYPNTESAKVRKVYTNKQPKVLEEYVELDANAPYDLN